MAEALFFCAVLISHLRRRLQVKKIGDCERSPRLRLTLQSFAKSALCSSRCSSSAPGPRPLNSTNSRTSGEPACPPGTITVLNLCERKPLDLNWSSSTLHLQSLHRTMPLRRLPGDRLCHLRADQRPGEHGSGTPTQHDHVACRPRVARACVAKSHTSPEIGL